MVEEVWGLYIVAFWLELIWVCNVAHQPVDLTQALQWTYDAVGTSSKMCVKSEKLFTRDG